MLVGDWTKAGPGLIGRGSYWLGKRMGIESVSMRPMRRRFLIGGMKARSGSWALKHGMGDLRSRWDLYIFEMVDRMENNCKTKWNAADRPQGRGEGGRERR